MANKLGDVLYVTDNEIRSGWLIKTHSLPSPEMEATLGLAEKTISPTWVQTAYVSWESPFPLLEPLINESTAFPHPSFLS